MTNKTLQRLVVTVATLGLTITATADTITGTVECTGLKTDADAVVYIERVDGQLYEAPEEPALMDQQGKVFLPKVLPVMVGTTVDFLNSDPFAHSAFTPDKCAGKFNLGSWATGETRSYTFAAPCVAVLLCSVHPEMIGYVVAVETPYFAVTADDGSYSITDVPPGTYEVSVWHERLKKQTKEVTVAGDAGLDFTLKR